MNHAAILTVYGRVLSRHKLKAGVVLTLFVLAGCLESIGLITLIPLFVGTDVSGQGQLSFPFSLPVVRDHARAWGDAFPYLVAITFCLFGLASTVVRLWSDLRNSRLRGDIEFDVRKQTVASLASSDWQQFVSFRAARGIKSILTDGEKVGEGTLRFIDAAGAALTIAVLFITAIFLSPVLSLITAGFGVVLLIMAKAVSKRMSDMTREHSEETARLGDDSVEFLQSYKFLFSTNLMSFFRSRIEGRFSHLRTLSVGMTSTGEYGRAILEGGCIVLVGLLLVLGLANKSVGELFVFLGLFYRMVPRATRLQWTMHQALTHKGWADQWWQTIESLRQAPVRAKGLVPGFIHSIELADVHLNLGDVHVLRGIDLFFKKGECLAITGPSGSGKTTLIDLLTGMLRPDRGAVRIDGRDINTLDLTAWRNRIGLVPQDPVIIHGSVLENIALGDSQPDRSWATRCADMASATAFVALMPQGIDSIIAERGLSLSGGQRQRLALARALYRRPELLILDEPTSALDLELEDAITESLTKIKEICTILLVTHRPELLECADKILRLDRGRLVPSVRPEHFPSMPEFQTKYADLTERL